ncbi:MAG: amidohydrolase family protein [Bacteroidota bacterium]
MKLFCYNQLTIIALFAIICYGCSAPKNHELVILNTNIIDVRTGEIIPNQSVAIDGDTISMIYNGNVETTASTKILHGSEKYLIPGLWDMHVHHNSNYKDTNPLLIANGIIGVREMWGNMYVHDKIKKGIADGTMDVPDVYTGSVIIDGKRPYWPGSIGVGNAEEARKVALEQIESGVDFLKVYSLLNKESFDAIAEVANEKGVPFAGHVPDMVTIQHTAKMGMASAEHFYGLLYGASSKRDSLLNAGVTEFRNIDLMVSTFSQEAFDSLCQILVEEDLWLSPTLVTNKGAAFKTDEDYIDDDRIEYMNINMIAWWKLDSATLADPRTQERVRQEKKSFDFTLPLVGKMHKKGVRFLAGSDYPNPFCFPGFSLHDELALMVEGGMNNLAALQTATLNPAIFMQKEAKYGGINIGKKASLVLLDKNPLKEIKNTISINAVILRGKLFTRQTLDNMLATVKKKVEMPMYSEWLMPNIQQYGIEKAIDSLDLLLASKTSSYRLAEMDFNIMGYELMQQGLMPEALKVLEKNTRLFPDEFNTYDSYAEALFYMQEFEKAKENYEKASALNPYYTNGQVMIDSISKMEN